MPFSRNAMQTRAIETDQMAHTIAVISEIREIRFILWVCHSTNYFDFETKSNSPNFKWADCIHLAFVCLLVYLFR